MRRPSCARKVRSFPAPSILFFPRNHKFPRVKRTPTHRHFGTQRKWCTHHAATACRANGVHAPHSRRGALRTLDAARRQALASLVLYTGSAVQVLSWDIHNSRHTRCVRLLCFCVQERTVPLFLSAPRRAKNAGRGSPTSTRFARLVYRLRRSSPLLGHTQ